MNLGELKERAQKAAEQFQIPAATKIEPFGEGKINQTFLVDGLYVLQRINPEVFGDPGIIVDNMLVVSQHLRKKALVGLNGLDSLQLIPTKRGEWLYSNGDGSAWRLTHYVRETTTFQTIQNAQHAFEMGRMLGVFHECLADLDCGLEQTIQGFHNTPEYLSHLRQALKEEHPDPDIERRKNHPEIGDLIEVILAREARMNQLSEILKKKGGKGQPIHGDPKVNNFLIDDRTGKGKGIVDWDTLMMGSRHLDIGDCLRSACNKIGSDTFGPEDADLDLDILRSIMAGYVHSSETWTRDDTECAIIGVNLIAMELAIRYLTDFLMGDVYFRSDEHSSNLYRAWSNAFLMIKVENKEEEMREILCSL